MCCGGHCPPSRQHTRQHLLVLFSKASCSPYWGRRMLLDKRWATHTLRTLWDFFCIFGCKEHEDPTHPTPGVNQIFSRSSSLGFFFRPSSSKGSSSLGYLHPWVFSSVSKSGGVWVMSFEFLSFLVLHRGSSDVVVMYSYLFNEVDVWLSLRQRGSCIILSRKSVLQKIKNKKKEIACALINIIYGLKY